LLSRNINLRRVLCGWDRVAVMYEEKVLYRLVTVGFSRQKGKLHSHRGFSPNIALIQKVSSAFRCLETKKSVKRKFKANRSSLAQGHVHPGDSPTALVREWEL